MARSKHTEQAAAHSLLHFFSIDMLLSRSAAAACSACCTLRASSLRGACWYKVPAMRQRHTKVTPQPVECFSHSTTLSSTVKNLLTTPTKV
mmetsp:Transcript_1297/g.2977  ORF Transcript_1297/g.2977 Transcript_1297/m.2977 type:complete len:91 (-) Transcript_1297:867-1139(-)